VRVNKIVFQVVIPPPLNPLPPGEGKVAFFRVHQTLGTYDFAYGYLSLAFVCLKIYSISLIINIVKQNIRSPHNIGIQNPDLSILIRPMEIDVIERKIR